MKRIFRILITLIIMLAVSVSVGYADAGCSYELFGNGFENGIAQFSYKSGCTAVTSPVDSENHGMAARMPYSTSGDCYIGPDYEVVSDIFDSGELKKAVVNVDVMFESYVSGNLRLISSEQIDTSKNGMYALSFGKNGQFSTTYTFTNRTNWNKYINYSTNQWYSFRVELNLEEQTFSLWINGDEITVDTAIVTNAKTDMIDFLHARVNLSKNSAAGAEDTYIYVDNFSYYIPYSYMYSGEGITVKWDAGMLGVTAATANYDSAMLVAARYEDGLLEDVEFEPAEGEDGILISQYSCNVQKGSEYKFFFFEDIDSIKPICQAKEYYSYTDMDYELLKDKWQEFLVGGEPDTASSTIRTRIKGIHDYAANLQKSMDKSADATSLWGAAYTASSHLGTEYGKIYNMALAYGTQGHELYKDEALRDDIIYGLEWMYANRYGQAEIDGTGWRDVRQFNWWDWFVSAPGYLVDTMMILHEELDREQIDKYLSLYTYLKTFMRTDLTSDANINSRAYNMFGAAILQQDEESIKTLVKAYDVLFAITDSGTGMYEDYSYIKHNMIAYTGVYGTGALLDRVVKVMSITGNTPFAIPQVKTHMYENWIFNAFEPLMVNAGIMSMVRGRGVDGGSEYSDGLTVFESVLNMIDVVSDEDAYKFKMMIKRHLKGDRLSYAYRNLTLPQIVKLESIINDESLPEPETYLNTRIYYNMDRAVHHKEGWTAGVAMSSERIANYESINHVNENGWYTGDGMLYLYTEPSQYNADYFAYADPYKRPGTTVDSQQRQEASVAFGQEYFSGKDFVGGVSMDDAYAVAVMDLESFHNDTLKGAVDGGSGGDQPLHDCDLTAKKSWFMFDNEIVCLGSDIKATGDYEVFTTVENRKITSHALTLNGESIVYGTEGSTDAPEWAHIEGTGGYYFPKGGNLRYRQITNTSKFFEMWLSHGTAPKGGSYAYAVLPLATAEETAAYAQNPQFEILSNTAAVQAVRHNELGITGYAFRTGGSFDGIRVTAPLAVMKKETDTTIEISLSDPTHKLSSAAVVLDGAYALSSCDEQLEVTVSGGKTAIVADLSKAGGATLSVTLSR